MFQLALHPADGLRGIAGKYRADAHTSIQTGYIQVSDISSSSGWLPGNRSISNSNR